LLGEESKERRNNDFQWEAEGKKLNFGLFLKRLLIGSKDRGKNKEYGVRSSEIRLDLAGQKSKTHH